ncbi:unnamed protein product, partial [Urochloa humidicola]
ATSPRFRRFSRGGGGPRAASAMAGGARLGPGLHLGHHARDPPLRQQLGEEEEEAQDDESQGAAASGGDDYDYKVVDDNDESPGAAASGGDDYDYEVVDDIGCRR